jgi:hypothetical protein
MANEILPANVDAKGRPLIPTMTDRELAEEVASNLRAFSDALENLAQNPMLKAMLPGVRF